MRIIFNDVMQYSDVDNKLKSPMLTDYKSVKETFTIHFDKLVTIDSIGIGNTDGAHFTITHDNNSIDILFEENGLYYLNKTFTCLELTITTDATYIGRLGAGLGIHIPTSIAKQPAFVSTAIPRHTLSGQVIPGIGGYHYRMVSLDSRYKLDLKAIKEIQDGYKFIGNGYPFFIDLTDEAYKLPFKKLYATETNQMNFSFESGIRKPLFSRRWDFEERF